MAENNKRKAAPKVPDCIDIHCEIQAVQFAQLSQMKSGESSAVIRERVIKARTIADLAGSENVQSQHIAEAIGYCRSALCDAFIVKRRKNLDRGDWAERGI